MPKYDDPALELRYQKILAAKRVEKRRLAKSSMLPFCEITMPGPENAEDVDHSAYQATPLARLLCQVVERIDLGKEKRVAVSVGPQFGKSEPLSRRAPAWLSGRNPYRNMVFGTYNDTFAEEFGGDVRAIMDSHEFKAIFPEHALRKGSAAKDLLITTKGGKMAFFGVGGSGTGKPADIVFIDDPIKSDADAQSPAYREQAWKWLTTTLHSRMHKDTAMVIVHTRWHEDDPIGRLVDPDHPERNKKYKGVADDWVYYNLPAVVQDPTLAEALGLTLEVQTNPKIVEQFGTRPMVSLWENRKSLLFLAESKRLDARGFDALYMGRPSPEEGSYFKAENLIEYHSIDDLPKKLRKYGASDHAVSEKQKADSTVAGCVGVDEDDDIWVLPDIFWDKVETDVTVEEILSQMVLHKPQIWWLESELISKSFGPFLKKRMHEEKVYITLDPKTPAKDKRTRARAIQGRSQQKRVHFPAFAPWWPQAKQQLLKFPYATNDDFVDWLSWIGLGLTQEYGAARESPKKVIKTGTLAWIKKAHNKQEREKRIKKAVRGW